MGLLSNRIEKDTLKAGDHIYSWRAKGAYAHHGIYAGDDKVIHFTRGMGQEAGTGTAIDVLLVSSSPIRSTTSCPVCTSYNRVTAAAGETTNGVSSSCLSCFLAGGALYRFEYGVGTAFFFAKARGGTCTRAAADPDEAVLRRADHLLSHGFRCYSLFRNNCEDFAIYCKTGLLVAEAERGGAAGIGQSGQAVSVFGAAAAIVGGLVAAPVYFATRYAGDMVSRRAVLLEEEEVVDRARRKEGEVDRIAGEASGRRQGVSVVAAAASIIGGLIAVPAVYCATRLTGDIGNRRDVLKVEVEDLTAGLASGRIRPANMGTPGQVQDPAATTLALLL